MEEFARKQAHDLHKDIVRNLIGSHKDNTEIFFRSHVPMEDNRQWRFVAHDGNLFSG